jgi:tetratricopeptide (TPR) repeat protein
MHPDDGSLIQGERLKIPEIIYHRVNPGEDWYSLANKYLGTSKRGKHLAELNGAHVDETLAIGKIVKIPYQLLYILAPDENLKEVAKLFMIKPFGAKWLKSYNLKRKKKYGRGDAVLIPLINIQFTEIAKQSIEKLKQSEKISRQDLKNQINAVAQIAKLRHSYENGQYLKIITIAQKMLGTGTLTNPQKIGIFKYLAFAYVAFNDFELAKEAFEKALLLQPSMELSPITTSPKILKVFNEVKQNMENKTDKKK